MDSPTQAARFAVVDVETSGLSVKRGNVLQIGVVLLDEQYGVVQRWSTLVAPRRRWWFRVGPTDVHGIHRRDLRGAPAGAEVLRRLDSLVTGTTVVAHNASFDTAFLQKAARKHRVPLHLGTPLCTLQLSRRLDPERQLSHRLADLCQRYDVPLVRAHDALSDAEATAGVLPHLLHAHGLSATDAAAAAGSAAAPGAAASGQLPMPS